MDRAEYIAVMKMLTLEAKVARQSLHDCERRGGEMLEQAKDAKHLVIGIAETMEVVTREMKKVNTIRRGSASESSGETVGREQD